MMGLYLFFYILLHLLLLGFNYMTLGYLFDSTIVYGLLQGTLERSRDY